MSNLETRIISFPLDSDNFLRRQCPLCLREFKILLKEDELNDFSQDAFQSFMIESTRKECEDSITDDAPDEFTCPYCGQREGHWWTQEQNAYARVVIKNVLIDKINKEFIRKFKQSFSSSKSGLFSLEFKGNEMEKENPWISPEINDMRLFDLPCCQRKMKVEDKWSGIIYCFFCGFPHNQNER